jgi:pimeloyl-ACP methyl ester carboxylesterase
MPLLETLGTTLYYEDMGAAAGQRGAMVLVHGFGDSGLLWAGQIQHFRDRFRVVTVDMRGHARSGAPDQLGLYTQDQVVEDLGAVMDHLGIERAVLGGHSLGGYTVMRFYQRYPERVEALILSGTGPGYRRMEGARLWTEMNETAAAEFEARGLDTIVDARDEQIGRHGGSEPIRHSLRGLAYVRRGVMRMPPLVDPAQIAAPLIVLVGENDTAFRNASEYMVAKAPQATGPIVLDGASHWANFDQPAAWNGAVDEFLAGLPG